MANAAGVKLMHAFSYAARGFSFRVPAGQAEAAVAMIRAGAGVRAVYPNYKMEALGMVTGA